MWTLENIEWLDIELTSFCNIECKGCLRVQSKYAAEFINKEYLSLEIIKKRFKREMFPNIKIVNFCGSVDEPTTHPQFFEIIEHFSDWGAHINIATNGSLRTPMWWSKLAGLLKDTSHIVTWGIDGSDALSEVYREGSDFNKVQQSYRAFNSAGGRSQWQFIVFEHNEHQVEEAEKLAIEEGFKNFKTIISHRKDTGGVKHKALEVEETPQIECRYLKQQRLFINHKGALIPCCHLNAKTLEWSVSHTGIDRYEDMLEREYDNININNNDIETILNGTYFKEIVESWNSDNKIPRCVKACKQQRHDKFNKKILK